MSLRDPGEAKNIDPRKTDKPFMIAIGTSHTYGQCDDKFYPENKWVDQIAHDLDLHLFNVGVPGVNNYEIQLIFNELLELGLLQHENLKYVMIEPRAVNTTIQFPIEHIVEDDGISYHEVMSMAQNENFLANLYPAHHIQRQDSHLSWRNYFSHMISCKENPGKYFNVTTHRRPDLKVINAKSEIKTYQDKTLLDTETLIRFMDVFSMLNVMIHTLPKHTKYSWWTWTTISEPALAIMKSKFPKLFESLIIHSVPHNLTDGDESLYRELICSCGHLNEQGHKYFWGKIKQHVRERYHD